MFRADSRIALCLALLMSTSFASAADQPDKSQSNGSKSDKSAGSYLRLVRAKDNTPLAMETPILRFAPKDDQAPSLTVDLVAAVHIAEKSYFVQLNREFESYDAVLYELVADEASKTPRPGDAKSNHPVSLLQNGIKDILGLEFQLQVVDYTRKNMVHADMSPDQFAESMRNRSESLTTMLMRMLGYAMSRQSEVGEGAGDGQLLLALFNKNRTLALKRVVAEQFANSEGSIAALNGPSGSTLISGRNKAALDVLRKEIAAGKKKIAIFYGAAHMPDFQTRLDKDFGLKLVGTRWLTAWDMKSEESKTPKKAATD